MGQGGSFKRKPHLPVSHLTLGLPEPQHGTEEAISEAVTDPMRSVLVTTSLVCREAVEAQKS